MVWWEENQHIPIKLMEQHLTFLGQHMGAVQLVKETHDKSLKAAQIVGAYAKGGRIHKPTLHAW
jgi:hypothetical protein